MDILEAIKSRRSIRKYKTDPVDDKMVEAVLDAARLAPSWSNTQCWKFIVIRDIGTKAQLAETMIANPELGTNPAINAICSAPVVIIACAEKQVSGYYQGRPSTDRADSWFMYDIALAMENLSLAATGLGLGTVHVGSFDAQKAASIIGLPEGYSIVVMTPLGHPEYQPKPRPRKELGEIVFYERFGQQ